MKSNKVLYKEVHYRIVNSTWKTGKEDIIASLKKILDIFFHGRR